MPELGKQILLVESSATQRYVLLKMLRASGYQVTVADDFEQGLELIQSIDDDTGGEPAIVIGWPAQTIPAADEILACLEQTGLDFLPVLILTHEADSAIKSWLAKRSRSAVLEWQNRDTIDETLQTLIASRSLPAITEPACLQEEHPIRILLVDDSPSVRSYYRKLLLKHGYEVEVASDVPEGFAKAEKSRFDIAIIDYFMPDKNGDTLCRQLQEHNATRDITIAMFTGTYLDQVIMDALDAGATECMFKNEVDALFLARVAAMSRSIRIKISIEAQRQRLQSILHSVGEGVYGVDNNGRITFINPTAVRILGYDSESSLLGQFPAQRFHHTDEHGQAFRPGSCQLQRAYGKPGILQSWETVFWTQTETMVPVECTVYPMYLDGNQEGSVVAFQDISERKSFEEKLRWQATHDPLTELFNRRFFEEQLEEEFERLQRSRETSALLYIDLDRFKYINDTAGHDAGDHLLMQVGRKLRHRLRTTDTLARLGGDEFAILLRNVDTGHLENTADAFRQALGETFFYGAKTYNVNGSIGVAAIDDHSTSPGDILAQADIACHIAKTQGGNQVHIYADANDRRSEMGADLGWSARLREAIEHDHFELYFHPIVPISAIDLDNLPEESGAIWNRIASKPAEVEVCFEVLLRLKASESSLIMPGAFIPTAERFHLMPEIDYWVIRKAIALLGGFQDIWKETCFSINLAGQTLAKPDLVEVIREQLYKHRVNPANIAFEITETSAIANITAAQKVISELTTLGCRFSLDDFGTGFSSFSHLKHLSVDCVKIDGMFVRGMSKDPTDHAMVISMNDISHFLGQKTVAEYVENAEILRLLSSCGVDCVQGYYIAQPFPERVARCQPHEETAPEPVSDEVLDH